MRPQEKKITNLHACHYASTREKKITNQHAYRYASTRKKTTWAKKKLSVAELSMFLLPRHWPQNCLRLASTVVWFAVTRSAIRLGVRPDEAAITDEHAAVAVDYVRLAFVTRLDDRAFSLPALVSMFLYTHTVACAERNSTL